ncbi:MAG: type II toxin-antitoxin system VapC family toxin [Planctomycetes bacterium]|nr:type II toxin-antitoxin system VapC family toxin [Planctomycetota bacterium]
MYVLDTDTMNFVFRGHAQVTARLSRVPTTEIATTIITKIELLQGRFAFLLKAATAAELQRAQQLLEQTEQALATVPQILPIAEAAAAEFDRLRANKKLNKIGRADLLIAAITLANRATLVSRNLKDFRQVPGLRVENWVD